MMRFDLKTPCKNCPFRTDGDAIRLACRGRAREIAEGAYRNGFPCHLSAVDTSEDYEDGGGGFEFGPDTQHCAGAIIMFIKDCTPTWPGIGNDEALGDLLEGQMDFSAPVFNSEEEFIMASPRGEDDVLYEALEGLEEDQ